MRNDFAFDITLSSATTSAGIFPPEQQSIAYNAFDKVTSITEGDKSLQITYGHQRQRIGQQYTAAGSTTNKVYAGACEYITKNGQTTTLTYLSGPEGLFALHVKNPNGTENIRYIHKDHLVSWHTITDENGNLLQELSFDAWGNLRNPATWRSFTGAPPPPLFDRGFTGHEHLYGFGLINMNGRMYDPVVSRMLSPDNFVQAPDFSQSFNRYSYAWNNPLVYTDPDGEIIVPILIGAAIGVVTNGINNLAHDQAFFQGVGKAALIGGISGAFSFGIGQAVSGMSGIGRVAFQTLAHGHLGGLMSGMNGGTYGQGFLSGAAGSLIATGAGSLFSHSNEVVQSFGSIGGGALAGGVGAELAGGNFWDGARNGAISAGLNDAYHSLLKPKIFVQNFDETLDFDKYSNVLESNLENNGFSSRLEVLEYSDWRAFVEFAKGNPYASVSIRDFYSRGDPLDNGILGYAKLGSNKAIVYGKGTYLGHSYNPSTMDVVNVTTHELGHAIFSLDHSSSGVMYSTYTLGSDLIPFTICQQSTIYNSIWGGGY